MVETTLLQEAAQVTAEEGTKEIAKIAAETAVKEAVGNFGWKEWVVTGLAGIGAGTVIAGGIFGGIKLTKFISKKIKAKKGIPVAEEVQEQNVEVEQPDSNVEVTVEQQ